MGRCRIGKEGAALNVDLRSWTDEHAVQGVHGPDKQCRERLEMIQVHALDVRNQRTETIERGCAKPSGARFTFCF
jgi:hypothetical protein